MAPAITVIIAVRNAADFVGQTIESTRRQTFGDWEYIIVDDASTDGRFTRARRQRFLRANAHRQPASFVRHLPAYLFNVCTSAS